MSHDLSRDRAARSRDNTRAERGPPDPPRHRPCDTSFIGGVMRALGLTGPMPHLISKYTWNTHLFGVHARQGHIRPGRLFLAYSSLNITFKGILMKLKIVALAISMEKLNFMVFLHFTVNLKAFKFRSGKQALHRGLKG